MAISSNVIIVFKRAVEQELMLRGSRDFAGGAEYSQFLQHLFGRLNAERQRQDRVPQITWQFEMMVESHRISATTAG